MAGKVLIRRSGHQELDELDATDIPALAYDASGAAAAAQSAAISAAATDATTKANAAASGAASALSSHEADTTSVHGIANTANVYVAGGTDVAVADGGTGASTAAGARTNLGLGTAAVAATGDFDAAGAAAAAAAASQPVDSDLTAIAALTTTSYGRALLALADAAAGRTALGLGTAAVAATGDFDAAGSVTTHAAAADPHTGYLKEADIAAKGDLFAGTANDTVGILTAGANDTVLTADSSTGTGLKWATPSAGSTPYSFDFFLRGEPF